MSKLSESLMADFRVNRKRILGKAKPEIKGLDVIEYYDADFTEQFLSTAITRAEEEKEQEMKVKFHHAIKSQSLDELNKLLPKGKERYQK